MNPRRLYRCRHDRQLAGVASGMAEYFEVDPTVVRILWILSIFLGGITILLYLILAVIIPLEPLPEGAAATDPSWAAAGTATDPASGPAGTGTPVPGWVAPPAHRHATSPREGRMGLFFGVLLVVFGSIALVNAVMPGWFASGILGPAFVVALGVALVIASTNRRSTADR